MKPIPDLDALLARAKQHDVFGTKMRSVIKLADPAGVKAVVDQQFEIAKQILAAGLVPIIEPEVDIKSPQKAEAEALLRQELLGHLDALDGQQVMLKLTLPEDPHTHDDLVKHPNVLKVVALSGGYSREEANRRLAECHGVVASFSRALSEGLTAQQSDEEFNQMLGLAVNHGAPSHIDAFEMGSLASRQIAVGDHCYGCTAGSGSSCRGQTADEEMS